MHRIGNMASMSNSRYMPHSPYFGPGFVATLHLASAFPEVAWFERLSVDLEMSLYPEIDVLDANGCIAVPTGPGLGCDPNPEVLKRYRLD